MNERSLISVKVKDSFIDELFNWFVLPCRLVSILLIWSCFFEDGRLIVAIIDCNCAWSSLKWLLCLLIWRNLESIRLMLSHLNIVIPLTNQTSIILIAHDPHYFSIKATIAFKILHLWSSLPESTIYNSINTRSVIHIWYSLSVKLNI